MYSLIFIIIITLPFAFVAYKIVKWAATTEQKEVTALQHFAQSHGYTFEAQPRDKLIDHTILNISHSYTVRNKISMPDGRCVLTCVEAEEPGGNTYLVCVSPYAGDKLNFNLAPKLLSVRWDLNSTGLRKYQLEGSLDTIYDFYVLEGSEQEALTLLQPDKLLNLIRSSPNSSLAARPGRLYYFYWGGFTELAEPGSEWNYETAFKKVNDVMDMIEGKNTLVGAEAATASPVT